VIVEQKLAQPQATSSWGLEALRQTRDARRAFQDGVADRRDDWIHGNRYFYDRLKRLLRFIVEPGRRVLEVRCQTGGLLASVAPSYGVGIEIGERMVACARRNHPDLEFIQSDPEDLEIDTTFDYILFSHIFDTVDILQALRRIRRHCTPDTRLIVINYNQLWQPVLELASKTGLRSKFVEPNWISERDVEGFLHIAGFQHIRTHRLFLCPKWIPLVSSVMNDLLARLPGLRRLCLINAIVARPLPGPKCEDELGVSVVIPCRNEAANVQPTVERVPNMGGGTELIFCDDRSTDGTADEVRRMQALYPDKIIRLVDGPGISKADNVWTGFRASRGDILIILDADLSVMPEELPEFFRALASGRGEFINGSRLVYPIQENAMKLANLIGNKFFGVLFSYLLDQRIKDTLCGTKALWHRDWIRLERNLGKWGIRDDWGDYELLFGASKLHLEIAEIPVHYQERVHGVSKMTRVLSNGLRMLAICARAWQRLEG